MDSNKKGYVAHCGGEKSCCPVPWISDDECRARENRHARVVVKSFNSPELVQDFTLPGLNPHLVGVDDSTNHPH